MQPDTSDANDGPICPALWPTEHGHLAPGIHGHVNGGVFVCSSTIVARAMLHVGLKDRTSFSLIQLACEVVRGVFLSNAGMATPLRRRNETLGLGLGFSKILIDRLACFCEHVPL